MTAKSVEQHLEEIRRAVEDLSRRVKAPALEPMAVSYQEAAHVLGCSSKHIRRMVKQGQLQVAEVGTLKRIPVSEIRRLLALAPRPARAPRKRERSPATEAQAIRALVKRRR